MVEKKGSWNTQVHALSRRRTLGKTTDPTDEGILCFRIKDGEPQLRWGFTEEEGNEVSDTYLLLHERDDHTASSPIIPEEMRLDRYTDDFCRSVVLRINQGEVMTFSMDAKMGSSCMPMATSRSVY